MGALDAVINEAGSRFGIGGSKVTTLLSSLFSFLNEQGGGLTGLVDRFRRTSVGDSVSSWLGVGTPSVSPDQVEAALGRDTVNNLAAFGGHRSCGTSVSDPAGNSAGFSRRGDPQPDSGRFNFVYDRANGGDGGGRKTGDVFRRTCCGEGRISSAILAFAVRTGVVVDWTVAMGGKEREQFGV